MLYQKYNIRICHASASLPGSWICFYAYNLTNMEVRVAWAILEDFSTTFVGVTVLPTLDTLDGFLFLLSVYDLEL